MALSTEDMVAFNAGFDHALATIKACIARGATWHVHIATVASHVPGYDGYWCRQGIAMAFEFCHRNWERAHALREPGYRGTL